MVVQKVAISMGDPAGIGPEIALKAALDPRVRRICAPLLVGDRRALEIHAIVMYHDQGHIAAKLLARNRAAGVILGAPVVVSSVAHGSALDIAGQNRADPEAGVEAVCRLVGAAQRKAA
ncbi:MAG: 4-hydroxythreonine-4-phosphate dehydrogenase PdxA [Stellaceae bacterium]